jgi:hypothetical protein
MTPAVRAYLSAHDRANKSRDRDVKARGRGCTSSDSTLELVRVAYSLYQGLTHSERSLAIQAATIPTPPPAKKAP